jgi:uncharacterized protein
LQPDAKYWIDRLGLEPHPEGGWFKETYRSDLELPQEGLGDGYAGSRSASTAIYFLVTWDRPSHLHRLGTDEVWHHYAGDALELVMLAGGSGAEADDQDGHVERRLLGKDMDRGEELQMVVPAGVWFGGRVLREGGYALCGCTMAPGFAFADFELGEREALLEAYPGCAEEIVALTGAE